MPLIMGLLPGWEDRYSSRFLKPRNGCLGENARLSLIRARPGVGFRSSPSSTCCHSWSSHEMPSGSHRETEMLLFLLNLQNPPTEHEHCPEDPHAKVFFRSGRRRKRINPSRPRPKSKTVHYSNLLPGPAAVTARLRRGCR